MVKFTNFKQLGCRFVIIISLVVGGGFLGSLEAFAQNPGSTNQAYLPILYNRFPAPPPSQINVPYFASGDITVNHFSEMAIFWFGRVTPSENYTDVRIGYNNQALVIYAAVFDRLLWYDTTPMAADLKNWDALTLYLDTNGANSELTPLSSYQFVAQLSREPEASSRSQYQAAYKWNGVNWATTNAAFQTRVGYSGFHNDNSDARGWAITFIIPFTSLGLPGKPADGQLFRMGFTLHDRDSDQGSMQPEKLWPNGLQPSQLQSWGYIHYGNPTYSAPSLANTTTTMIRHKLSGAVVPDAAVGGTTDNQCPGDDFHIWNVWGVANYGKSEDFNIQNQSDISDWPCFSKYYVTFPLSQIPANKQIVSAQLKLYHWSNSGSIGLAKPSFIHVMTVSGDWNENSITWNNAPLVRENISAMWVEVQKKDPCPWPCEPRVWDVSRAVVQAYQEGIPLRLALYSTDSDYHSGKYFTSSDSGDWNAVGRPTLEVVWGNP